MKKTLGLLILVIIYSCSQKLHNSSSLITKPIHAKILEKSIIENPVKGKCGLTIMAIDLETNDTFSPKVVYESKIYKGEIYGSLIDHLCTINTLHSDYYKIQITSVSYDTLNIDSLFFENNKKFYLKIGLNPRYKLMLD
jgi:hypothetical protein